MFDKTLYISRTDKRQDFAYRQQNGWSIVHTPSYLQKPAFGSVPLQPAETRAIHFRVPKTLTFKMRLGAQPFLWKWVLFPWEWKIISILKLEYLPSFWNRGPRELVNGLLYREVLLRSYLFRPVKLRLKHCPSFTYQFKTASLIG